MHWQCAADCSNPPRLGLNQTIYLDPSGVPMQKLPGMKGLVVIDVVEGTAIAALPIMHRVIQSRPLSFPSVATAQAWAQSSGTCIYLCLAIIQSSAVHQFYPLW